MSQKKLISLMVVLLTVITLAVLPLAVKKESTVNLIILIFLYVILASSWNILGGYTGQTNLGHAAFFGLGSLVTRLLWTSGAPFIFSMLAGCAVAVAFALLIGLPAFKLKGVYFAIGTLALAQILFVTVGNAYPTISSLPAQYLATYELLPRYYVFFVIVLLTVGTAYLLTRSKYGLGMMAVREQEDAAESLGVSALRHKLLALTASAFFAAMAGGGFAYYHVSYYLQFPFTPVWTFDAVMMTYIGGIGSIIGPIIGAIFFVVVKEYLALNFVEMHLIVFGVIFILVVLFLPGGLVEAWEKLRKMITRRSQAGKIPQS
jgi:branched-chain amino acid transport system permease protein